MSDCRALIRTAMFGAVGRSSSSREEHLPLVMPSPAASCSDALPQLSCLQGLNAHLRAVTLR